jgi:predicted GIY-YIG superfamily endonuclease
MSGCTMYRLYSGDTLLYVGQTERLRQRLAQHKASKDWFPQVDRVVAEEYRNRTQAMGAENRAITGERPVHNVQNAATDEDVARRVALLANPSFVTALSRIKVPEPVRRSTFAASEVA